MRANRKKEWSCVLCDHRYEQVSLGETCPRDGGVLVETDIRAKYAEDPLLGQCVDGRYHLIDVLGIGGFGTVYRCFDTVLKTEFAFKTIIEHQLINKKEIRQRFLQEGRLMSQLQSQYVVTVHSTGEWNGTLYMVLELVRGLSLKQYLQRKTRLPLKAAAAIISQVLMALEHSHCAGLIHRDLKPSNILFTDLDAKHLKLIDFGIAKSINAQRDDDPKTRTGLVIGTVQYMAPEQLRKDLAVGPQSDLYAVGILFYEILTGTTPFQGSQAEVAAGHLYQKAPNLDHTLNAPPAVDDWLQTVLSKAPDERYSDALTMRLALAKALSNNDEAVETTLPIADDTVRMAPDMLFMQEYGLDKSMPDNEAASQSQPPLAVSSSVDKLESAKSSPNGKSPHKEVAEVMENSNTSKRSVHKSPQHTSRADDERGLAQIVRDREHEQAHDSSEQFDEPKATQKLTSIELLRAAQRSKVPKSVVALDIETPDSLDPRSLTGNTALEDVPEALLGYQRDPKPQHATAENAETKALKQMLVTDNSSDQAVPSPSGREERASMFTAIEPETSPRGSNSLLAGMAFWWLLPVMVIVFVASLAIYYW